MTSIGPDFGATLGGAVRRYGWIVIGIGLLLAVYLLPPDTSLAEVQRRGLLSVCVPEQRPPLVTGDPAAPGLEIELLAAIAAELDVRLALNTVPAMGGDFNPRSWGITRAQCAIIGGGLIDSTATRSFLAPGPAYGETGWMAIVPAGEAVLQERRVGVLATLQGTDRIALSRYLRSVGARPVVVRTPAALAAGLADGSYEAGISAAMVARALADEHGWTATPLPPPFATQQLILGLWKGDLTLKRAVEAAFARIEDDGRLAAIRARYGAA